MRTLISIYYYTVIFVWSLFYFVLMCVVWLLTVLFDRERIVLHKMSHVWAKSIVWLNPLWKLRVTGMENILPGGRYVITVNHQSMIDIPLMYVLPKINFKWVAKNDVYKWPLFGVILLLHNDIVVKQGSVAALHAFMNKGVEHLKRGTSVIIFPEGTRSRDGEIHKFREGAFLLAREAGVSILPCVINGVKDFAKGWRVNPTTFEIAFMPPIQPAWVAELPLPELIAGVRDMSVTKLAKLRK